MASLTFGSALNSDAMIIVTAFKTASSDFNKSSSTYWEADSCAV